MDKWLGDVIRLIATFALVAGVKGRVSEKPCLRSISLDHCPASSDSSSTQTRVKDVQTLNYVARLLVSQNTSICNLPYDSKASFYPPECCSFPFTLNRQLHTICVSANSSDPPGCFLDAKTWVLCEPKASGYQATEETKTLVIDGAQHSVTTVNSWIVFQKRTDASFNFTRPWYEYRDGFGNFTSNNFWLGLEKIYQLCRLGNCQLRIEIKTVQSFWFSEQSDLFFLDNELGGYSLHHSPLQGDSGSLLTAYNPNGIANGMRFSTFDNDRDTKFNDNCALGWAGGWWYNNCFWFNLNGRHGTGGFSVNNGRDLLAESRMMLKLT